MNSLFSFLASTVPDPANYPVPEDAGGKLVYGLQVTAIGLLTVFAVLAILMVIVYLFRLFFYTIPMRKNNKAKESEAKADEPAAAVIADSEDEDEIAAVIAAAVAAIYEPSQVSVRQKYKIKSFKRI